MRVTLLRLCDAGWQLPKFRLSLLRPVPGALQIGDWRDPSTGRTHTRAQLLAPETGKPLDIPPLLDARVVHCSDGALTLTGVERISEPAFDRETVYAQTWLVEVGSGD